MALHTVITSRREMLKTAALAAGGSMLVLSKFPTRLWTPGVFAEELELTPSMAEGPFYPDRLPLDTDNDLLIVNDSINPAVGEVTHLGGKVLAKDGRALRNALVEIWQVDSEGSYLHSKGANSENGGKRDGNFQGYGRFVTNLAGEYYFRTVKPVPYPGRTPHIHFAVTWQGKRVLTTQLLVKGEPANERDVLFRTIKDEKLRSLLVAEFRPLENSRVGELVAEFDMIVGITPEE